MRVNSRIKIIFNMAVYSEVGGIRRDLNFKSSPGGLKEKRKLLRGSKKNFRDLETKKCFIRKGRTQSSSFP